MSRQDLRLTQTRFEAGVWEGVMTGGAGPAPRLVAQCAGRVLDAPEVVADAKAGWRVRLSLPAEVLGEGAHCLLIAEADTALTLALVPIVIGAGLTDDLREEVLLLRAELEMLQRAFRRHCAETRD